jgi:hypothetical protein
MITAISRHSAIEEQYFYPAARHALGVSKAEIVLEALEEHHVVKWTLSELERLPADGERFDAKVTVLMKLLRQHVKEEETLLFPKLRQIMEPAVLKALGKTLELAKIRAPTRPHPRGPDTPPANVLLAPVEVAMDRGRGLLKALAARNGRARALSRKPGSAARPSVH